MSLVFYKICAFTELVVLAGIERNKHPIVSCGSSVIRTSIIEVMNTVHVQFQQLAWTAFLIMKMYSRHMKVCAIMPRPGRAVQWPTTSLTAALCRQLCYSITYNASREIFEMAT